MVLSTTRAASSPAKDGWRTVRFGDVVRNVDVSEKGPLSEGLSRVVGLEHIEPGSLHIRNWGDLSDGTSFSRAFREGQVLFGKRRAYQRKVAHAEFDGICSGDILVFEAVSEELLPELLPFIVQSEPFFEHALQTSAGSLSPRTKWAELAKYEFALPPKDEQRRIAEILWAADESVASIRVSLSETLTAKRILFRSLFRGLHEPGPRIGSSLGEVNREWTVRPLIEVVDFLDGRRIPVSANERAKRRGPYPYYGASGVIDWIDDFLFDETLILLGEDGANIVDRSTPLAFKVSGKIWVNNHAHVLRVKEQFDVDFITEYLESISYLPYKTGTAQPKLNKKATEGVPVPIPPPSRQEGVASVIRQTNLGVDQLNAHLSLVIKLATSLREGLLAIH